MRIKPSKFYTGMYIQEMADGDTIRGRMESGIAVVGEMSGPFISNDEQIEFRVDSINEVEGGLKVRLTTTSYLEGIKIGQFELMFEGSEDTHLECSSLPREMFTDGYLSLDD